MPMCQTAAMATRCVAGSHLCYNNKDHFQLGEREEWSHLLISPILFSCMFCIKCYICLLVVERGCLHYQRNSISQLKEHIEHHPKTLNGEPFTAAAKSSSDKVMWETPVTARMPCAVCEQALSHKATYPVRKVSVFLTPLSDYQNLLYS